MSQLHRFRKAASALAALRHWRRDNLAALPFFSHSAVVPACGPETRDPAGHEQRHGRFRARFFFPRRLPLTTRCPTPVQLRNSLMPSDPKASRPRVPFPRPPGATRRAPGGPHLGPYFSRLCAGASTTGSSVFCQPARSAFPCTRKPTTAPGGPFTTKTKLHAPEVVRGACSPEGGGLVGRRPIFFSLEAPKKRAAHANGKNASDPERQDEW
jgi:hypothetical protein